MCELLGMSARRPTDIVFSFSGFRKRGGQTGPHKDGWGIAFYEKRGARMFNDPHASANSEMAEFLRKYSIRCYHAICHIRKARVGGVGVHNTHPFYRELWGEAWTFAHNGLLKGIKDRPLAHYRPIGSTDSEWAFCLLLARLRRKFGNRRPSDRKLLFETVARVVEEISRYGIFNILLCDGTYLYTYCYDKLSYTVRQPPFRAARLIDEDYEIDFARFTTKEDRVAVIATRPLTRDEEWTIYRPGEFRVFRHGKPVWSKALQTPVLPKGIRPQS